LRLTGVDVTINKVHIDSEEKAIQYKFVSSPTIRVNSRDIQLEVRESLCQSCGDLCGEEVDCRVWVYDEKEYSVPPKAMIIDAILKEIYSDNKASIDSGVNIDKEYQVPENLKKFFRSMGNRQ